MSAIIILLLALSGLDGSGKTTQAKRLSEVCRQNGMRVDVLHLKMVGSDKYMPKINRMLQECITKNQVKDKNEIRNICSALLFCEKVQDKVLPSLLSYDVTILDRYRESALCYHYLMDGVYPSVQRIYNKLVEPDINIFLDLPPDDCYNRIYVRKDLSLFETPEYLEKSYAFYQSLREKFIWVDASKSIETITRFLISTLQGMHITSSDPYVKLISQ